MGSRCRRETTGQVLGYRFIVPLPSGASCAMIKRMSKGRYERDVLPAGLDDLWGSSCEWSTAIAGASAKMLAIPGYRESGHPEVLVVAREYLRRIKEGSPSTRALYSGRVELPGAGVEAGSVVRLPLTALSENEDFARTFAIGPGAALLRFERGCRVMRYSDVEWITAGNFEVVSDRRKVDPFWKTPLRVITLRRLS